MKRRRRPSQPHPLAVALRRLGWWQSPISKRWHHDAHPRRDDGCNAHGRLFVRTLGYTLRGAARRARLIPR